MVTLSAYPVISNHFQSQMQKMEDCGCVEPTNQLTDPQVFGKSEKTAVYEQGKLEDQGVVIRYKTWIFNPSTHKDCEWVSHVVTAYSNGLILDLKRLKSLDGETHCFKTGLKIKNCSCWTKTRFETKIDVSGYAVSTSFGQSKSVKEHFDDLAVLERKISCSSPCNKRDAEANVEPSKEPVEEIAMIQY